MKPLSEQPSAENVFDPTSGIISGYTGNDNPGHIVGDMFWPMFRMMYAFSGEMDDFQVNNHSFTIRLRC